MQYEDMPFDEFSMIMDDYIELLKQRQKDRETQEAEQAKQEAEQKRMFSEMQRQHKV